MNLSHNYEYMLSAIRILAKGYLFILLATPLKLQKILGLVKETLIKTNLH